MSKLFDVADVVRGDDQEWSAVPYDVQYYDTALQLIVQDKCTYGNAAVVVNNVSPQAVVYTISSFGVMVSALAPERCTPREQTDLFADLEKRLEMASNEAASYTLWNGIPGWTSANPFLLNSDVGTVSAVANDYPQTAAKVLQDFEGGAVGVDPVLHLGYTAALELAAGNAMSPSAPSDEFYLTATGTPIVTSPFYPLQGVAATGPIKIHVGGIGSFAIHDYTLNRVRIVSERVMAIEFNPMASVRAI